MFKRISLFLLCCVTINGYASSSPDKTQALHAEVATHRNPNITKLTHPTLYGLIEELSSKANIAVPRYISTFDAEYVQLSQYSEYRKVHEIQAYLDIMGDLHICRELLSDLSYDEVQGILAIAISAKSNNNHLKLAGVGVSTYALTLIAYGLLYKNGYVWPDRFNRLSRDAQGDFVQLLFMSTFIPAAVLTKLVSTYMQKDSDLKAAQLTKIQNVINGIKGIDTVKDTYEKENFFTRIAKALKIKEIGDTVFYPIRAFNTQERINYLEKAATN